MSRGWIKIYRDIKDHWIWDDPKILKIWLDILFSANHEDKKITIKSKLVHVKRGSFWSSIRKLSDRWGTSEKYTTKLLNLLENDGMIFCDKNKNYGTLITICNYCKYQANSATDGNTDDHTANHTNSHTVYRTKGTPFTDEQEYKELIKNDKEKRYRAPAREYE